MLLVGPVRRTAQPDRVKSLHLHGVDVIFTTSRDHATEVQSSGELRLDGFLPGGQVSTRAPSARPL